MTLDAMLEARAIELFFDYTIGVDRTQEQTQRLADALTKAFAKGQREGAEKMQLAVLDIPNIGDDLGYEVGAINITALLRGDK